ARTWWAWLETVKGIMASGSVIGEQRAASSAERSRSKNGAQRVLRMAKGERTRRSERNAENLTAGGRRAGAGKRSGGRVDNRGWVRSLQPVRPGDAVSDTGPRPEQDPGARLPHAHRPGSDAEATQSSLSESQEGRGPRFSQRTRTYVQTLLETVHQALREGQGEAQVIGVLESGFDDGAVWRMMWERHEPVACRVYQRTGLVEWQTEAGAWSKGLREEAAKRLKPLAMLRTQREVPVGNQEHPKQQDVGVEISVCSFPLASPSQGPDQIQRKAPWLVQVRVLTCPW